METASQRRRRRARADVTRVAVRVFAEHGYAATSTDQVAAAADLSRSTLFRYFADKEDLLFALEDDLLAAARAAVAGSASRPPWTAVRAVAVALAREVAGLRELLVQRDQVIASSPALQARAAAKHRRWEAALTGALRDEHALDAADAALLAKLAVACFQVAEEQWLAGGTDDLDVLVERAFARLPALLSPA